ncbi:MAG: glycoside hydrolase family 2 TIM barrel-domain containing protein [Cyclobacteriaceae bacterium]
MGSRLLAIALLLTLRLFGQEVVSFNEGWQFKLEGGDWERVHLPHTWNAVDPFDDTTGYYCGTGFYQRNLTISKLEKDERLFLKFEAANQIATLFVNGQQLMQHHGGYTAFFADLTEALQVGENEILLEVDNAHNPNIVPLKGDFNFYGGIYRDMWLIKENAIHFENSDLGSESVFFTPTTDGNASSLAVKGTISNFSGSSQKVDVRLELLLNGSLVEGRKSRLTLSDNQKGFIFNLDHLTEIRLWSPKDPVLYTGRVSILDRESGKILDAHEHKIGFRYFRFDEDEGFFLNGESVKLIGANRHQDFPGLGNALTDDHHRRDMKLLKEMGANFFRTAHYPQDRTVLDMADQLGLVVTMEIPLDHDMTNSNAFRENVKNMMREMIAQYYNHPSIVIWAHMNEMFLGRKYERDRVKIDQIVDFSEVLDSLTRAEDPTRRTLIPNHGDFEVYQQSGITGVPQVVGWNLYYGWYEPDFHGFTAYMERFKKSIPDKPTIITEYGAGADPRIRSLTPERFDFSVDWQLDYHLSHLKQINSLPYLAGGAVWNLFDFGSETRQDADQHINSKGLMSFDRKPKDTYHLYKAWLSEEPFIEIGPSLFPVLPMGVSWPIRVFTNQEEVELIVNGKSAGSKKQVDGFAEWIIPLDGDKLVFEATAEDIIGVKEYRLSDDLNINTGANFYFYDPLLDELWLPDQPLENGKRYGHAAGKEFRPRNRGIGSDRAISLSNTDPIFQTQNVGLNSYQLSVTSGTYSLTLLFSNLDQSVGIQKIIINDVMREVIDLDKLRPYEAVVKKYEVESNDMIVVTIENDSGATILNGIKATKIR